MSLRLILLFALFVGTAHAGPDEDLRKLREALRALQQEYSTTQKNEGRASDALRTVERNISALQRELQGLQKNRDASERALAGVDRQATVLQERIRKQQAALAGLLRQAYQQGRTSSLERALDGGDANQLTRDLYYLGELSRSQSRLIDSLRSDLDRLGQNRQQMAAETAALKRIADEREAARLDLQKQRDARKAVLAELGDKLRTQQKQIDNLKRDAARLASLMARLQRLAEQREAARKKAEQARERAAREASRPAPPVQASARPPAKPAGKTGALAGDDATGLFSRLRGRLGFPVQGELMNRFGAQREGGIRWQGLFIRAAGGAQVHAVAAGSVVFSDWLRGYGNLIVVDHGEGYMSLYSNNESLYKRVGEPIRSGETIATVGNSGGQAETGLYFELRHKSRPLDPLSWMKR